MNKCDDNHGGTSPSPSPLFLLQDAIGDLNRIALMDNDAYHASLLRKQSSRRRSSTPQEEAKEEPDEDVVSLQDKLVNIEEALRQHPEHADVGRATGGLARSIYGFHSNLHALKAESDEQTSEHHRQAAEIQSLKEQVAKLESQNGKLRTFVRKIVHERDSLSAMLTQSAKDKKKLIRHAKALATEIDSAKQTQEELQVLAHEHVLMASATCCRERKETSETESTALSIEDSSTTGERTHSGERDPVLDCDLSYSSGCHYDPPPRLLMIPARGGAVPLFLPDESTIDGQQQQHAPDHTDGSNDADMPVTSSADNESLVASSITGSHGNKKEGLPQKERKSKGLLNDIFLETEQWQYHRFRETQACPRRHFVWHDGPSSSERFLARTWLSSAPREA